MASSTLEKCTDPAVLKWVDPYEVLCNISALSLHEPGTKLGLTDNRCYIVSAGKGQFVTRWYYGDSSEDLAYLVTPLFYSFNRLGKEGLSTYHDIVEMARGGLDVLAASYGDKPLVALVIKTAMCNMVDDVLESNTAAPERYAVANWSDHPLYARVQTAWESEAGAKRFERIAGALRFAKSRHEAGSSFDAQLATIQPEFDEALADTLRLATRLCTGLEDSTHAAKPDATLHTDGKETCSDAEEAARASSSDASTDGATGRGSGGATGSSKKGKKRGKS